MWEGGPRGLVKQVFLSRGGGPSHLSIWGTVVLSTEGTAPPGGPSASACLAPVCVCVCVRAHTCVRTRGQPHVQGWGLALGTRAFPPGAGSGHVMPLAGRGGAGSLQQEAAGRWWMVAWPEIPWMHDFLSQKKRKTIKN